MSVLPMRGARVPIYESYVPALSKCKGHKR